MDKVSVIVPVYNVENYLEKCLDSIISQTYKNLEIILVDDGSTDSSGKICDSYAKKDKRIKVIHKENGGLSDARNMGLDVASGKFISFVDSDDYIDKRFIEILYNNIIKTKADISICDFVWVYDKKIKYNKYSKKRIVVEGNRKYDYLYNEYSVIGPSQWNKLYKKYIFDDIRFPYGKLCEDQFVIHKELFKAKKVSYILKPLYYYVQRSDSIMHVMNVKRFDVIDAWMERVDFFHKNKLYEFEIIARKNLVNHIIYLVSKFSKEKKSKEEKKSINNIINRNKKNIKVSLRQSKNIKDKIKYFMFLYFRKFTILLARIKIFFVER